MYVPSEPTLFQKFTDAGAWAWTNGVHSICMNTFIGLLMSANHNSHSSQPASWQRWACLATPQCVCVCLPIIVIVFGFILRLIYSQNVFSVFGGRTHHFWLDIQSTAKIQRRQPPNTISVLLMCLCVIETACCHACVSMRPGNGHHIALRWHVGGGGVGSRRCVMHELLDRLDG